MFNSRVVKSHENVGYFYFRRDYNNEKNKNLKL